VAVRGILLVQGGGALVMKGLQDCQCSGRELSAFGQVAGAAALANGRTGACRLAAAQGRDGFATLVVCLPHPVHLAWWHWKPTRAQTPCTAGGAQEYSLLGECGIAPAVLGALANARLFGLVLTWVKDVCLHVTATLSHRLIRVGSTPAVWPGLGREYVDSVQKMRGFCAGYS
jgi:hypothetical protein